MQAARQVHLRRYRRSSRVRTQNRFSLSSALKRLIRPPATRGRSPYLLAARRALHDASDSRSRLFERLFYLTHFSELGLAKPLLKALSDKGYVTPTPIQAQAIPPVMAGKDLLGIAQTGTGKTAAFALPILHRLAENKVAAPRRGCRVLVLSPTRELATQIGESFRAYGKHLGVSVAVIFGGVKYGAQIKALGGGLDVLVATPGRQP